MYQKPPRTIPHKIKETKSDKRKRKMDDAAKQPSLLSFLTKNKKTKV
jgi:hypothetical protein